MHQLLQRSMGTGASESILPFLWLVECVFNWSILPISRLLGITIMHLIFYHLLYAGQYKRESVLIVPLCGFDVTKAQNSTILSSRLGGFGFIINSFYPTLLISEVLYNADNEWYSSHAMVQHFAFGERMMLYSTQLHLVEIISIDLSPQVKSCTIALMSVHYLYTVAFLFIHYLYSIFWKYRSIWIYIWYWLAMKGILECTARY